MAGKRQGPGARSALELHAHFFDRDRDGSITVAQALSGMTSLGLPWPLAAPLSLLVVLFLGFLTRRRLAPSIHLPAIIKGKHPFETGVFDDAGALDEAAFEQLFLAPHCRQPRDRLSYGEMRALVVDRGDPRQPFGPAGSLISRWFSAAEMYTLFCLAADCQKLVGDEVRPALSRKSLRRFYEGRLFPLLARRRRMASARGAR